MDMRLRRQIKVTRLWVACTSVLVVLVILSAFFCEMRRPILGALALAPVYGLAVYLLTTYIAAISRRPTTQGDYFRIGCWTLFAGAEGVREYANSYYRLYHPQLADHWVIGSAAMQGLALFAIVMSLVISPPRRVPKRGCCPECGYTREGLTSDTCPECGHDGNV